MSLIIPLSLLSLVLVVSKPIFHRYLNPVSLFCSWWVVWFCVFELFDFGFRPLSTSSIAMLVSSVYAYSLGFILIYLLLTNRRRIVNNSRVYLWQWLVGSWKGWWITYAILLFSAIYLVVGALKVQSLLGSYSAVDIRNAFVESGGESVFGSAHVVVLRDILIKPLCFLLLGLGVIRVLEEKKSIRDYILPVFAFILLILYDFGSLARGQVVTGVLFICVMLMFYGSKKKVQQTRRLGMFFVFLGVVALTYLYIDIVSMARMDSGFHKNIEDIVAYWVTGFPLFEIRDKVIPSENDGYLYSIGGVQQALNFMLRRFDLPPLGVKSLDLQPFFSVGTYRQANAVYTWCLPFYVDMGVVGVVLFPFLYGISVGFVFVKYNESGEKGYLLLFSYLKVIALFGVLEWKLMWMDQLFVVLILWLVSVKVVQRRNRVRYRMSV